MRLIPRRHHVDAQRNPDHSDQARHRQPEPPGGHSGRRPHQQHHDPNRHRPCRADQHLKAREGEASDVDGKVARPVEHARRDD